MKLSQDLYNAGILRRQRTGPSDDWAFDEQGPKLSRVVIVAFARLHGCLFGARKNRMRRNVAKQLGSLNLH